MADSRRRLSAIRMALASGTRLGPTRFSRRSSRVGSKPFEDVDVARLAEYREVDALSVGRPARIVEHEVAFGIAGKKPDSSRRDGKNRQPLVVAQEKNLVGILGRPVRMRVLGVARQLPGSPARGR